MTITHLDEHTAAAICVDCGDVAPYRYQGESLCMRCVPPAYFLAYPQKTAPQPDELGDCKFVTSVDSTIHTGQGMAYSYDGYRLHLVEGGWQGPIEEPFAPLFYGDMLEPLADILISRRYVEEVLANSRGPELHLTIHKIPARMEDGEMTTGRCLSIQTLARYGEDANALVMGLLREDNE